jgi:hypothetical protein
LNGQGFFQRRLKVYSPVIGYNVIATQDGNGTCGNVTIPFADSTTGITYLDHIGIAGSDLHYYVQAFNISDV